jgi:hypothetical protein
METSSADASQCDTENTGQWILLPSHERLQHLTMDEQAVLHDAYYQTTGTGVGQMTQDTYGKPYLHTFLAFVNS